MNNKQCGCNCQPTIMVNYPYTNRGAMYQCDCCNAMYQPGTSKYPAGGPMQENAFMVVNTVPYLVDNFTTNYGPKLSVSESIYTRITKRKDPSCINLAAVIDMTGDIITNSVWNAFLEQTISGQYEELEQLLPIQKSNVTFKLYFHIADVAGGVVYESSITSVVKDHLFHYTDVQDFFVTSFKNVMVANIPQLDYQGVYNLVIDKMEAYVDTIDTKEHISDELNPYYTWANNNTKINVQHDTISEVTPPDATILIASTDINYGMAVQLNLTTRLKISFSAFMSNTIAVGDTFGVYKSLYEPTQEIVDKLVKQVEDLQATVSELTIQIATLRADVNNMYYTSEEYKKGTFYHEGALTWITKGILYQVNEDYTTTDDESITVAEAFQNDIDTGKLIPVTNA